MRKSFGLIELFLLVLFSYPLFYYAYKFGTPDLGNSDFYSYYSLYKSWDFNGVVSPFNTRLISPYLVYLLHQTGLYYDTTISFQNPLISQRVFFSAVFFNYGCTVLTAWVVTRMVWRQFQNRAYALLFGAAYLLGFGTLFYSINPLTDAFSYLLCALIFEAYFLRSWWILPLLVMAVVQREIIFAYIALMALFDGVLKRTPRKYALGAFVASILGAISYVVLRKTIFYTSKHSEQMEVSSFLDRILHPQIDVGDYIRQVFLNQNILLFYLLVIAYKLFKKLSVNQGNATLIAALYLQGVVIGLVALLGNNLGRFVNLLSPMILLFVALELKSLLQGQFGFSELPRNEAD